jgi:small ubiquitin-related modifier
MLGNPPQTALDATIPRTEPVSHGDEVCDSPGQLTVVALRNDEGDEDVDLANPNTYTLVRVWSESSETVTMPLCDSSLQLNNSLFCSFVAANRPCVSDTRTAIHLEQKTGMRDRACGAECPGSTDKLNFMAKDSGRADKLTQITLKVREGGPSEVHFGVRPSTKFHKIFEAYCSRKGLADLAEWSVRFIFNGLRLDPNSTPGDCNMEDGDTIDVLMEQVDTPDFSTEDTGNADKLTHITLRVGALLEHEYILFKVRPSAKFHKIFDAYCSRKALSSDSVRFCYGYYAARLDLNSTPSKENMEDGDTIDAFMEQCGGMFVQSSGRDDNEPLAAEPPTATVDVTICIPGDKEVTVSIGAQQTFKEATALAVLQLQLEVAESLAAETNKTMADIRARMKEVASVGSRTMGNSA